MTSVNLKLFAVTEGFQLSWLDVSRRSKKQSECKSMTSRSVPTKRNLEFYQYTEIAYLNLMGFCQTCMPLVPDRKTATTVRPINSQRGPKPSYQYTLTWTTYNTIKRYLSAIKILTPDFWFWLLRAAKEQYMYVQYWYCTVLAASY